MKPLGNLIERRFVEPLNISYMFVTFFVLKEDKSSVSKLEELKNIEVIYLTSDVFK